MIKRTYVFSLLIFSILFPSSFLTAQKEARIFIAETAYDFGQIEAKDGIVKHSFLVKNEGASPLEFIKTVSSSDYILCKWREKVIEPGETSEIEITFDPSRHFGLFNEKIQIFSTGSEAPVILSVKGKVKASSEAVPTKGPEFSPSEWVHDFGQINEEDGFAMHVFRIKNTGDAPLIISHVQSSCGCAEPEWTSDPIQPGEIGDVVISYSPKNRPGPFRKNLTVYSNVKGRHNKLTITGVVIPEPADLAVAFLDTVGTVEMEKKKFIFHTVRPKEITAQEIWIRNFSDVNRTLSIENVPSYIKVEAPVELEPHKAERLKVTVDGTAVTTKGRLSDVFTWTTRDPSGGTVSYEMPVSANFIDDFSVLSPMEKKNGPSIGLSTTLLEYGKLKRSGFLGLFGSKSASKELIVTNEGSRSLDLHSVSCDDKRLKIIGLNRMSLRPGESMTLKLLIKEKEVKDRMTTELYIVCNDPHGPVRQVKIMVQP